MSREERTEWRDLEFSIRHREFGDNVPFTDCDGFAGIEYDQFTAVAFVEYKKEFAKQDFEHSAHTRVMRDTAMKAGLMFFVVVYSGSFNWYLLVAMTERSGRSLNAFKEEHAALGHARLNERLTTPDRWHVTEKGYITWLYWIRSRKLPLSLRFDNRGVLIPGEKYIERFPERRPGPFLNLT